MKIIVFVRVSFRDVTLTYDKLNQKEKKTIFLQMKSYIFYDFYLKLGYSFYLQNIKIIKLKWKKIKWNLSLNLLCAIRVVRFERLFRCQFSTAIPATKKNQIDEKNKYQNVSMNSFTGLMMTSCNFSSVVNLNRLRR